MLFRMAERMKKVDALADWMGKEGLLGWMHSLESG